MHDDFVLLNKLLCSLSLARNVNLGVVGNYTSLFIGTLNLVPYFFYYKIGQVAKLSYISSQC